MGGLDLAWVVAVAGETLQVVAVEALQALEVSGRFSGQIRSILAVGTV